MLKISTVYVSCYAVCCAFDGNCSADNRITVGISQQTSNGVFFLLMNALNADLLSFDVFW